MSKSTHFFGQPVYGQLIKSLDKEKVMEISRKNGGEKYIKSFDGYTHLVTMLYAIIMCFDSLREIETVMIAEVRKLHHLGIDKVPKRRPCRMPMPDAQRSFLRRCTATHITPIKTNFPQTTAPLTQPNG